MKLDIIKLVSILSLIINISFLQAQVTIGSAQKPLAGSLLDLTQGSITTKGMMLPRLNLQDLNSLADINRGEMPRPNPAEHVGLMVYNVHSDEYCYTSSPGVFLWTGFKWTKLGKPEEDVDVIGNIQETNDVKIYVDQDNQAFPAATFGTAGTWMLTNLSVKKHANGTPITLGGVPTFNTPSYVYRNEANKLEGALYNGAAISTNSGGTSSIQGVCPNGWHIPKQEEWNKLLREIYSDPAKYGTITNVTNGAWNSQWDNQRGYIADDVAISANNARNKEIKPVGVGSILKNICLNISQEPQGISNSYSERGFNAYLTGFMSNGHFLNVGLQTVFWTSSFTDAATNDQEKRSTSIVQYISADEAGVAKSELSHSDYYSVRCIKD